MIELTDSELRRLLAMAARPEMSKGAYLFLRGLRARLEPAPVTTHFSPGLDAPPEERIEVSYRRFALNPSVEEAGDELPGFTPLPEGFVNDKTYTALMGASYVTYEAVAAASDEELLALKGIGQKYLDEIRAFVAEHLAQAGGSV